VFREKTKTLRELVYGVPFFPLGVPVELELIFEVSAYCRPPPCMTDRLTAKLGIDIPVIQVPARRFVHHKCDGSGLERLVASDSFGHNV